MKIKPRDNPREIMGETVVADIIIDEYDETRGARLCVKIDHSKQYRLATIHDTVELNADQIRWMADVVDEFNRQGKVVV